jgi:formylglycine-generating enzyme required for sulfatase activity
MGLSPVYDFDTWAADFSQDGFHLPTEAQWERAAVFDGERYYYRYGQGSDMLDCTTANLFECNPLGFAEPPLTSAVGAYAATSPAGCHDMSGNVWEWCHDYYSVDYYMSSPGGNPSGPGVATERVVRGGSWYSYHAECRAANRHYDYPGNTLYDIGFRIAR